MRSPDQLVRARLIPQITLRAVPADDAALGSIFHEVGDRHLWSAESWAQLGSPLAKPHWLIDASGPRLAAAFSAWPIWRLAEDPPLHSWYLETFECLDG